MKQPTKVLLAEDNAIFRRFVSKHLQEAGYQVFPAVDGLEAFNILQSEQRPDVLLLDLMMPELNGLEVLEKMKEVSQTIPTILMSAIDLPPAHKTVLLATTIPYLVKPFQPSDLFAKIEKLLASPDS